MKKLILSVLAVVLMAIPAFQATAQESSRHLPVPAPGYTAPAANLSKVELFKLYITGDFSNWNQIMTEREKGRQVHPFALHINRLADHVVKNRPQDLRGFFVIEESYYSFPNRGATSVAPHLFFFRELDTGDVELWSMTLPKNLAPTEIRTSNKTLSFDFSEVGISPTFPPTTYSFDPATRTFFLDREVDLGSGRTFRLTETISPDRLDVLELLKVNGKPAGAYTDPIVYDRF